MKSQHFNHMIAMKPEKETNKKFGVQPDASFDYFNRIIYWELEEGLWYTPDLIEAQMAQLENVTETDKHGLLVNATFNAVINLECMEQLIKNESPFRNAIAIVTGGNLATFMMAKFYISTMTIKTPIKLFKSQDQARVWLMEHNLQSDKE
jgi:hypothetical protein